MNCPNCNAPNRAEARFCALCGAALSSHVPDAEVPVAKVRAALQKVEGPGDDFWTSGKKRKRYRKKMKKSKPFGEK